MKEETKFSKENQPRENLVEKIRTQYKILKEHIKSKYLLGIIFTGSLSLYSCGYKDTVKLPNNYVVKNVRIEETVGYKNIFITHGHSGRNVNELIDKSRIKGVISYIGFLKIDDKTISINNTNINQKNVGGDGGFILSDGGDAKGNITTVFDDRGGIMLKVKPIEKCPVNTYILQLKTREGEISPTLAFEEYKKGDTISMPTIKFTEFNLAGYSNETIYRTLNKLDFMYLGDIKK